MMSRCIHRFDFCIGNKDNALFLAMKEVRIAMYILKLINDFHRYLQIANLFYT